MGLFNPIQSAQHGPAWPSVAQRGAGSQGSRPQGRSTARRPHPSLVSLDPLSPAHYLAWAPDPTLTRQGPALDLAAARTHAHPFASLQVKIPNWQSRRSDVSVLFGGLSLNWSLQRYTRGHVLRGCSVCSVHCKCYRSSLLGAACTAPLARVHARSAWPPLTKR